MSEILIKTEELRAQLRQRGGYRSIAAMAGLSKDWVASFASGRIANPTVRCVAALDVALSKPPTP